MNRFEARHESFNLIPKDMRGFKAFLANVPDTASYKINVDGNNVSFDVYWLQVNPPEPEPMPAYSIHLPMDCKFGKSAFDTVVALNPADGIPFRISAADTINLTYGFVDIMVRKIKNYQAPYILAEGWTKEHMTLLQQAAEKYRVIVKILELAY